MQLQCPQSSLEERCYREIQSQRPGDGIGKDKEHNLQRDRKSYDCDTQVQYPNERMGAAMIKDDPEDLGPQTVIRGVIQSWELEIDGRDTVLLMPQSDMACLEMMIC